MVSWSASQHYFTKPHSVSCRSSAACFSENFNEAFNLSKLPTASHKVLKHLFVYLHSISIWQKVKLFCLLSISNLCSSISHYRLEEVSCPVMALGSVLYTGKCFSLIPWFDNKWCTCSTWTVCFHKTELKWVVLSWSPLGPLAPETWDHLWYSINIAALSWTAFPALLFLDQPSLWSWQSSDSKLQQV